MGKGRSDHGKGVINMSPDLDEEPDPQDLMDDSDWEYDGPDEVQESRYPIDLGDGNQLHVRVKETPDMRVVDFAVIQQTQGETGHWHDVAKVDSAHDQVHKHSYTRAGGHTRKDLVHLDRAHGVGEAADTAVNEMLTDWEDNLRRWHG